MNGRPRWSHDRKRNFTVKSFSKAIWDQCTFTNNVTNELYGLDPPRGELLPWFLILKRMNTKCRLKSLNLIQENEMKCPFFNKEEEMINHLFLRYNYTWRIWVESLEWWHIQMYITNSCWMVWKIGRGYKRWFPNKTIDIFILCHNLVNMAPKE